MPQPISLACRTSIQGAFQMPTEVAIGDNNGFHALSSINVLVRTCELLVNSNKHILR